MERKDVQIHHTAEVSDKAIIGAGTRIWHQAQVREGVEIGDKCIIGKGVYVDFGIKIGRNVKLQNGVNLYHGLTIEDDVFVGPGATFTNDMYPRALIWSDEKVVRTLVKRGASIGANATIICGATIGENAMVGAGSVVTKDVPDHALVFGNPARVRGFVCKCGMKLSGEKKVKEGVEMTCPKCECKHTIQNNVYEMIQ